MQKLKKMLDEWNDCTGALVKNSSWYCEVLSLMEDAYKAGREEALSERRPTITYHQEMTEFGPMTTHQTVTY